MPFKDPEKKKQHNLEASESGEGQARARHRKGIQRYKEDKAETFWKFKLRHGREFPALLKGCSKRCIQEGKERALKQINRKTEIIVCKE